MWHLPYWICIGVLAVLLLVRESQHHRIQAGLLDRILVSKGVEALPPSPIEQLLEDFNDKPEIHPKVEKKLKDMRNAIHFNIPGMPEFKGK